MMIEYCVIVRDPSNYDRHSISPTRSFHPSLVLFEL